MFKIKKKTALFLFFFSFLLLFLFSGLRYNVGMDYSAYEQLYKESLNRINPDIKELGWAYFFYLFRNIGIPFPVVILFISFLTISNVFVFIRRYSPYPFLSVLIFFCFTQYYTYTFNVIRQCLASYIFFVLLECIKDRRLVKYLFAIGFITFFVHTTAIILLPLYFIIHRSYSVFIKLCVILVSLFCAKFLILLIASSETYRIYLAFEQYAEDITITTYMLILIGLLFLIYEVFAKEKIAQEIILFNINFLFLLFLIVACFFAGTPLIIVFLRFAFYFTPVLIVLLPLMIKKVFSKRSQYVVVSFIIMGYVTLFCYTISSGGVQNRLVPYETVLLK